MVTRLAEDVWWFDFQGVNAYLVDDDGAWTLVDAGMPWHGRRLVRSVASVAGSAAPLERVLVTHFDFDHVGGLDSLSGLGATVYIGAGDEPYLTGRRKPGWNNRKGVFQRAADVLRDVPDLRVETVDEGDTVGGFTAYQTPGHTPGHTSFLHEGLSAVVLGDLVREADGAFDVPPWFLNYDHDRARGSVAAFLDRAPAFDIACPGHGTPFVTDGDDRLAECADTLRADVIAD
jgi:glyoxylase-like metal-dependent hydrolase (beta-lactamase superfamily II)